MEGYSTADWLWLLIAFGGGLMGGLVAAWLAYAAARRIAARTRGEIDDLFVAALHRPASIAIAAFAVQVAIAAVPRDLPLEPQVRHGVGVAMIAAVGWMAFALVRVGGTILARRAATRETSPFAQRAVHTRVRLLTRVLNVLVAVVFAALILLTFPAVRELGAGILASAGVAGIVVGLAAQSFVSNLIAGVQLAFDGPIHIGDSVVIDGEYGIVEQMGATFVTVRTWDLRRLLVPLRYFLENRVENWTLHSADLLGTVFLYVDYAAPLDEIRDELKRVVSASEHWDKKTAVLAVTDVTEQSLQLRAVVSAASPSSLWELRCEVREKLVKFIIGRQPRGLPVVRAALHLTPPGGNGAESAGIPQEAQGDDGA